LKDATVNLVIGVPSFYFKDATDPMALNQMLAQLSPYFQNDSSTQFSMSNALMTQNSGGFNGRAERAAAPVAPPNLGPEIGDSTQTEDLFVFTIKNVTLAKGQRMVFGVSQQTLDYKDVYTLDVGYVPPTEINRQIDARLTELAKQMAAPKVMHKIRMTNSNVQPFTTAPALILKDGKLLSQGLMTYASKGGTADITLTTAIEVRVKKKDKESRRTANAANFNGDPYWRIDIASSLELINNSNKAIEVEVTRHVLGNLEKASEGVKAEMVNLLEDDDSTGASSRPSWWSNYPWPAWWSHFNGIGRLTWTAKLEPGKSNEQSYSWYYYWR
jgi:hypothetical protein